MTYKFANRVRETSIAGFSGTGAYSLAGAPSGSQSFVQGIGNGNTTCYIATNGVSWEINLGTVTDGSPDTLSRDWFIASSTGSAINWSSATLDIFVFQPAETIFGVMIRQPLAFAGDSQLDVSLDSTYAWYKVLLRNLRLSSDGATVGARISIAASMKTDANYQSDRHDVTGSTAGGTSTTTGTSFPVTSDVDTGVAGAAIDAEVTIKAPGGATYYKALRAESRWLRNSSGLYFSTDVRGAYIGAVGAADVLRIFPSAGTLLTGDAIIIAGRY
jgi:hypothetical protein